MKEKSHAVEKRKHKQQIARKSKALMPGMKQKILPQIKISWERPLQQKQAAIPLPEYGRKLAVIWELV